MTDKQFHQCSCFGVFGTYFDLILVGKAVVRKL